jgi:hypothetical protein
VRQSGAEAGASHACAAKRSQRENAGLRNSPVASWPSPALSGPELLTSRLGAWLLLPCIYYWYILRGEWQHDGGYVGTRKIESTSSSITPREASLKNRSTMQWKTQRTRTSHRIRNMARRSACAGLAAAFCQLLGSLDLGAGATRSMPIGLADVNGGA